MKHYGIEVPQDILVKATDRELVRMERFIKRMVRRAKSSWQTKNPIRYTYRYKFLVSDDDTQFGVMFAHLVEKVREIQERK